MTNTSTNLGNCCSPASSSSTQEISFRSRMSLKVSASSTQSWGSVWREGREEIWSPSLTAFLTWALCSGFLAYRYNPITIADNIHIHNFYIYISQCISIIIYQSACKVGWMGIAYNIVRMKVYLHQSGQWRNIVNRIKHKALCRCHKPVLNSYFL